MNIRQLRKRMLFWQEVLNIGEWKITLRWGTEEEMDGNLGLNYFSAEELESTILLAKGEGEETLIHELIHLVFDGHKAVNGKYDPLHERGINRTAKAFIRLIAK